MGDTFAMHAAWFMTSLTQTAGHKMAAFAVVISRLSNVDLKKKKKKFFKHD